MKRNAEGMSLLILTSEPNCQGFKIERWGEPDRRDTYLSGLWLVAEEWVDAENKPWACFEKMDSKKGIFG